VNSIGSSLWSPIIFVPAAYLPIAPPQVILQSVDQTQISLKFLISTDDGGAGITNYHLWISSGAFNSAFVKVTAYDGTASTYSISAGDVVSSHTVAVGNFYAIKYIAENAMGLSADSQLLYVALARMPTTPIAPVISQTLSTRTKQVLNWVEGASTDIPVTGYRLYSDNGLPGNSFLIYDGQGVSTTLTYSHDNLVKGTMYTYTLEVLNYNGPSVMSPTVA
jgi:hypothetical protein